MTAFLIYLIKDSPFLYAALFFTILNFFMYGLGVAVGEHLGRRNLSARISAISSPFGKKEIFLGVVSTIINILVTLAGLILYRNDILVLPEKVSFFRLLFDVFVFLFTMDALMYVLHRAAHLRIFYAVHALHHRYEAPSAGALFVLHPIETVGFGSLWIVLLFIYPFSFWAVVVYVGLNLYYGLVGHLGVEFYPKWWAKNKFTGLFTTCTFHDQHHRDPQYNHGFYTTLWDKIFGTLHPSYQKDFSENANKSHL
jgi:lathosterol oxidase